MPAAESNSVWLTRKRRIDPQLHAAGSWGVASV